MKRQVVNLASSYTDNGATPIIGAVYDGHLGFVEVTVLYRHGGDLTQRDRHGMTALDTARQAPMWWPP